MQKHCDTDIVHSWYDNAGAWTRAVRDGLIESRRMVTDQAIIQAVLEVRPRSVLDVGCGEGWLVRALSAQGVEAEGVDAVPELVTHAREAGGTFRVASYEDIGTGQIVCHNDAVVCNFSLLGEHSVQRLIASLAMQMPQNGWLIVQTVHPVIGCGEQAYADGWREEHWSGFGTAFPAPSPWYFRTLASWIALLHASGWNLCEIREPLHPATGRPASIIFIAKRA